MSFTEITQEIQAMSILEKIELQQLLEKYIIEDRRNEIYETYQDSLKLISEKKLNFSSDINELRNMLEE